MSHDLILAARTDGHRLNYVRILAEHSLSTGNTVTVALGQSGDSTDHHKLHLARFKDSISILDWSTFTPSAIASLAETTRADRVIDPDGDQLANSILKHGKWPAIQPITLLIMRPEAQKSPFPGARKLLTLAKSASRALLSRKRGVRVVTLVDSLERNPAANQAPDPIDFSVSASSINDFKSDHGLDSDRFWFAIVGAIDARKNVDIVASAIASMEGNAGLLLAGKVGATALAQVESAVSALLTAGTKVVVIDRLLSDAEIDNAIAAADCVVLAHSNEGASGIMGKAVVAGTRVVAAGAQSLKQAAAFVPAHALWAPLDSAQLAKVLADARTMPAPPPLPQTKNLFAERLMS